MRSLRNIVSIATTVLATLALVAAAALIVTTTILKNTTADVAAAVESVRLAEEAEIQLLLHARAKDDVVRRDLAAGLRGSIEAARAYVTTDSEAVTLHDARERVEAYLRLAHAADAGAPAINNAEARAFSGLERLVAINVVQARDTNVSAQTLGQLAEITGTVVALSIIVITAGLLVWLRRRVIRPLFALANTVKEFASGVTTVRADESGPSELREMSRRFNDMADALAAQRHARAAFLGGVAHDLRTPLSALGMAADIVAPDEPLPPERHVRSTLALIRRQIRHLERMLDDIVDVAKIDAGMLELRTASHDLRDVVRDAVELFAPSGRRRIDVVVPPDAVAVACDEVRIAQAVTNLVSNAIKYSPAETPIEVELSQTGETASIVVADRGPGIPREQQETIFEPFRRGAHRDAIPGAGLGLYNVRRIIEAHGGRIDVDSMPSRGTTFRITVPLAVA